MLRPHIVKTVFFKELREMLRDRRSLAVMFGVPLVLYPLLTIALASLGSSKIKDLKETKYKITVVNAQAAPELARRMAVEESGIEIKPYADPIAELRAGKVDGVVEIQRGSRSTCSPARNPRSSPASTAAAPRPTSSSARSTASSTATRNGSSPSGSRPTRSHPR